MLGERWCMAQVLIFTITAMCSVTAEGPSIDSYWFLDQCSSCWKKRRWLEPLQMSQHIEKETYSMDFSFQRACIIAATGVRCTSWKQLCHCWTYSSQKQNFCMALVASFQSGCHVAQLTRFTCSVTRETMSFTVTFLGSNLYFCLALFHWTAACSLA